MFRSFVASDKFCPFKNSSVGALWFLSVLLVASGSSAGRLPNTRSKGRGSKPAHVPVGGVGSHLNRPYPKSVTPWRQHRSVKSEQ